MFDTVDGRNPAPVGMVNIPLLAGFYTSQVVQDFFHQQECIEIPFLPFCRTLYENLRIIHQSLQQPQRAVQCLPSKRLGLERDHYIGPMLG